jgi:hypothetical protein
MLIARKKKEENIIEYLLYMFQIEDLIRAHQLDADLLFERIIAPQVHDEKLAEEYREWYTKLIRDMKTQRKEKEGHIFELHEVQMELFYLHNTLINLVKDEKYTERYTVAQPFLKELRQKSPTQLNDVDLAIQGLYMKLLLRLKGAEIHEETEKAFEAMRNMLAHLAQAYHRMKKGDLEFYKN